MWKPIGDLWLVEITGRDLITLYAIRAASKIDAGKQAHILAQKIENAEGEEVTMKMQQVNLAQDVTVLCENMR